jgi:V8-like Glu-specific endopeptidase
MAAEPAELTGPVPPPSCAAPAAERPARRVARCLRGAGWAGAALVIAAAILLAAGSVRAAPLNRSLDTVSPGGEAMWPAAGTLPAADAQAMSFDGTPAVGALFTTVSGRPQGHFCSASVIDSPGRDLLVTAAHCISEIGTAPIAFVPGYDDGRMPYGIWRVTRVFVDHDWLSSSDPDDDVAFLVVAGRGKEKIQDVTGGEALGLGLPVGRMVSVIGYPQTSEVPILCENPAREFSPDQLEFDCGGYTDGTSGSPLLEDVSPATGLGMVIGVIGGYEQGGYTPSVSYAVRFGPLVQDLYKTVIRSLAPRRARRKGSRAARHPGH